MTDILDRPSREPVPEPRRRPDAAAEGKGHPARIAILAALVVLAGLGGGWPLLVMIAALVVMIFLHELGHYLTAKWAGMKVTEFFIGFGPRIWSFRRGETEYGIKVIPAGAYVKIIGMHNLDEFDEADADRTYMSKPFWRRLSVAVAGSTMHFLLALLCFFVAFGFVGLPGGAWPTTEDQAEAIESDAPWSVAVVSEGSTAESLGLQPGDRVRSIDGRDVGGFADFRAIIPPLGGELVEVVYERGGEVITAEATIGTREGPDGEDTGFFGVGPQLVDRSVGVGSAVGETLGAFGGSVRQTFTGLATILSPSGLADLGRAAFTPDDGPTVDGEGAGGSGSGSSDGSSSGDPQATGIIGISDLGAGLLDDGEFGFFLAVFATVNIFIGVFNLLPLLPLDGGHVVIAVYEKIRSMLQGGREYHIDVVKLLPVTYGVVLVLAFLGISTIVLDTRGLVGG